VIPKFIKTFAATVVVLQTGIALADDSIAAKVADGKPWAAKVTELPSMTMTLNPDGSGLMKVAIMKRAISWKANGVDGLCLSGLPDGDKCMTLKATAKGFEGVADDGKIMVLTRG
jgi:hypothetical protein